MLVVKEVDSRLVLSEVEGWSLWMKYTTSPWRMATPLITEVIVFRDRAHRHRPGFDPGAGVVYMVAGLHAEVVALVSLAHEVGLGLGGVGQPGGPGAGDAHFILHLVVAQAGRRVLPGPGDPEAQGRDRWHLDGHGGSGGILHHAQGLRGLVAGAVGGGDGQGSAEGVGRVEGIGMRPGCGDGAAQRVRPTCPVPGQCHLPALARASGPGWRRQPDLLTQIRAGK
jgi:hypothetical protein